MWVCALGVLWCCKRFFQSTACSSQGLALDTARSDVRPYGSSRLTAADTSRPARATARPQVGAAPERDLMQYLASAGQLPRIIAGKQPKRIG